MAQTTEIQKTSKDDGVIVTMTKKKAEGYIRSYNGAAESMYEALYELYIGNAYKLFGKADWAEFATSYLKGVKGESTARRLAQMITNHQQIVHALPAGSDAKTVLDRMPDRALERLSHLSAEQRADVVQHFANLNLVPSELQMLTYLDETSLINEKGKARLAKLLENDTAQEGGSGEVDATPLTILRNSIETVNAALLSIIKNVDGIQAAGYKDYYDLVRGEFNLSPAFPIREDSEGFDDVERTGDADYEDSDIDPEREEFEEDNGGAYDDDSE